MIERLAVIRPEIALFIAACVVMLLGVSRNAGVRRLVWWVTGVSLVIAGWLAITTEGRVGLIPGLTPYVKTMVAVVGLLLVLVLAGSVDRGYERLVARGAAMFDPIRSTGGEFAAFFLFSLTGVMLCASADDLIWLFLALELTSLPTYVMVALSTSRERSGESAVKYFFLGAFGAAVFLYGFALLYGATGTTMLPEIAASFAEGRAGLLGIAGLTLALVGVAFKMAAAPMHFYAADVYEGSSAPVAAHLAFAPKAAGLVSAMLLLACPGWSFGEGLPEAVRVVVWVMAAVTMTVGNAMALLQSSVKRMLAYSSVAHSGYMLVGLVAGPGTAGSGASSIWTNGLSASLFYMLCYGLMNVGAFAALAALERGHGADGETIELETIDDLRGLCKARPWVGWGFVLSALSLLGFPPLLGFFAKLFLFTSAISAGEIVLVVVMGLNSAVGAFYYLRLVSSAYFERDGAAAKARPTPLLGRALATALSGASVVATLPFVWGLQRASVKAVQVDEGSVVRAAESLTKGKTAHGTTDADTERASTN